MSKVKRKDSGFYILTMNTNVNIPICILTAE